MRKIRELSVARNSGSDMMVAFLSIAQIEADGRRVENVSETSRCNRVRNQMNSQIKRVNLSGYRWQRAALAALALMARVRLFSLHTSLPEMMAEYTPRAEMLVNMLCKHLSVSVLASAVAIRVRGMIT